MDEMQANQPPVVETSANQFTPGYQQQMQVMALDAQFKRGINWFYWIAGLSLVNSVLWLTGANWSFIVGLGATQLIDGAVIGASEGSQAAGAMKIAAFGVDLLVAGVYVLIGYLGLKRIMAAIIAGMVFYALDGLVFLMVQDWLSIGFHAFVLWCIFGGLKMLAPLKQAQREMAQAMAQA